MSDAHIAPTDAKDQANEGLDRNVERALAVRVLAEGVIESQG